MKLVDRLKPIYSDKLEIGNLKYPALVGIILEDLERAEFVGDLKYNTVVNLSIILDTHISPYNFFTEQIWKVIVVEHYLCGKQIYVQTVENTQNLTKQIKILFKTKIMSKISNDAWEKLKKQIEYHLKQDPNLTDIAINYQVRIPKIGTRNYLKLGVTIEEQI